ncbi:polymorphic toxin type 28 domain-containing protein [Enterobacter sp. CFBP8995]|nr:polymorphic toxin type 28 domain-containing protein [Pantoea rodasii]MDY0927939.1 polymorphic toxin type 28 domain-containing protein [Enterobacter sp. CFBP8995]
MIGQTLQLTRPITDALLSLNTPKDHDITGTLKDMDGNPVPKESGGYWDHMQEM